MTETDIIAVESNPKRSSPVRRVGCGILLVIWFLLLLTPCFLFVLATQQEIRLSLGSAPGQEFRIWLIMEAETRGVGISSGRVDSGDDFAVCVETTINYVLWAGREDGNVYCECYQRGSELEAWALTSFAEAC